MDTLTLVDIFFVITGISVVIITLLIVVALLYLIFFIRRVKQIGDTAMRTTKFISEDLSQFSQTVKTEGFKLSSFINFVLGKKPKHARKKTDAK